MKKQLLFPLFAVIALTGCTFGTKSSSSSSYTTNSQISVDDPDEIDVVETDDEFAMSSKDGQFSSSGSIYTISDAGTYSLSGKLSGQILVSAGDNDEVILELNGASISYDQDSPIKITNASKVEISAKKDTDNIIRDNRGAKTSEISSQGEGAISADVDLKLKGYGTLVVAGGYNNGVYTSKDLTIQNLTLKSTGYNNAIKGKDSITISSGSIQAYASNGNGLRTDDSDTSSKGNQRGTITVEGGSVYVDSLRDAFDASYNVVIDETSSDVSTSVSIKTGKNSSYYTSSFKADSEKGLKAANEIIINKGTVVIASSDDAIHSNYGTSLENGSKGLGNITINDGLVEVASGDDGLHADNTLTINGGKVVVTGATEGYEGNYININGGYSYIYGTDDGVNCSKKTFSSCAFKMSGGYLDVAVKSGDTDGIDSNGSFTLSGGTIVTRGSPGTSGSGMSTGLDVDGTISMTGGTLVAFNGLEKSPSASSTIKYAGTSNANSSMGGGMGGPGMNKSVSSSISFAAGSYVLSGDGLDISFVNDYVYGSFQIYSSSLVSNKTYTLYKDGSSHISWSQTSNSVTIS